VIVTAPIAERTRADAQWTPERYSAVCRVKRFFERYDGDAEFRRRYAEHPRQALASVAPELDFEAVQAIRQVPRHLPHSIVDDVSLPPLARDYCRFVLERSRRFNRLRVEAAPIDPRFRAWRRRRMEQADGELGAGFSRLLLFSTAAFELSTGCSVGCWFCGVSAPRLEDHFRYGPANRRLWRDVLETMVELYGREVMRINFCFWATDPLDNPDYEAFADDYREITGAYPPLTTALALRDPGRTRRMLARFDADVCRFSILTVAMLDRLHREFTPEELGGVDLALLAQQSKMMKANVGRFRERVAKQPELLQVERDKRKLRLEFFARPADSREDVPSTIACLAGFLINMVERRIRLISPCAASDRWPLGFVVYDDRHFQDGDDFRRVCEDLVRDHMVQGTPS
jgi:radical SAM family RiPP maturation amino acid epimerase